MALLFALAATGCDKITTSDLWGRWVYDTDTRYSVTFNQDNTLGYSAPEATTYDYVPTYYLNGEQIIISVKVGSTTASEFVEILSLKGDNMVIYYEGDLMFGDSKPLSGEYSLTRK